MCQQLLLIWFCSLHVGIPFTPRFFNIQKIWIRKKNKKKLEKYITHLFINTHLYKNSMQNPKCVRIFVPFFTFFCFSIATTTKQIRCRTFNFIQIRYCNSPFYSLFISFFFLYSDVHFCNAISFFFCSFFKRSHLLNYFPIQHIFEQSKKKKNEFDAFAQALRAFNSFLLFDVTVCRVY